jgi:hypothetical protein
MIIAKSTQPSDLADGAAQPSGAGRAGQRWEDDGGPLQVQPPISPLQYRAKPTWSVLSLRDLSLAIRLGHWPDNPAHVQRAAAEAGCARAAAAAAAEARENDGNGRKENT